MSKTDNIDKIYEYVVKKVSSPEFRNPIKNFIDENCGIFLDVDENTFEQGGLFNEFTMLVDNLLDKLCKDSKISEEMFLLSAKKGLEDEKNKKYFEQLIAFNNYNYFKSMMTKRNYQILLLAEKELEKNEKMKKLNESQKAQKKIIDKEMQQAIKMSLALEDEKRRIQAIEEEDLRRAIKLSLEEQKKKNLPIPVSMPPKDDKKKSNKIEKKSEEKKDEKKEDKKEDKKDEKTEDKKEDPILEKKEPEVPHQFRKGAKRPYKKTIPYGVDNNPIDYTTSNNEQIKATKKTNDPFLDFKNIIIDRGSRGILSLKRTFMITDDEGTHTLTFNNFEKYIKDYRLPLNDEEIKKIFDKFDTKKQGIINYDDLLNELLGKINDYRTDLLMKVFEKFDPEHTGNASLNEIRKNYNPNLHPEVLKGNKSSQEELSEFLDVVEYIFSLLNQEKAGDDVITIEEFLDFYKNISFAINDDEYFNSIVSNVWGLNKTKNFGKKQLNKKLESLFDN